MSGSETIYSESEISEDETLHNSDEEFIDDSETSDSESASKDEDYISEFRKIKKIDKVEITVKIKI